MDMKISCLLSEPQQQRSREALEAVLEAGQKLLRTDGLASITMQQIAQHADVSVGNIYRIFGNKDALLLAVYEVFMNTAADRMEKTLHSIASDQPTRHFLCEVGTEYGRAQAQGFKEALLRHPRPIMRENPEEAIEFCHRMLFNNFVMQTAYGSETQDVACGAPEHITRGGCGDKNTECEKTTHVRQILSPHP